MHTSCYWGLRLTLCYFFLIQSLFLPSVHSFSCYFLSSFLSFFLFVFFILWLFQIFLYFFDFFLIALLESLFADTIFPFVAFFLSFFFNLKGHLSSAMYLFAIFYQLCLSIFFYCVAQLLLEWQSCYSSVVW